MSVSIGEVAQKIEEARECAEQAQNLLYEAMERLASAVSGWYSVFSEEWSDSAEAIIDAAGAAQQKLEEVIEALGTPCHELPVYLQRLTHGPQSPAPIPPQPPPNTASEKPSYRSGSGQSIPEKKLWPAGGSDTVKVAQRIANHARGRTIRGVDPVDTPKVLAAIMIKPGYPLAPTSNGKPRMAWWHDNMVVIRTGDAGTFFYPTAGFDYVIRQINESTPEP